MKLELPVFPILEGMITPAILKAVFGDTRCQRGRVAPARPPGRLDDLAAKILQRNDTWELEGHTLSSRRRSRIQYRCHARRHPCEMVRTTISRSTCLRWGRNDGGNPSRIAYPQGGSLTTGIWEFDPSIAQELEDAERRDRMG
jgi:hypothetical protein